MAQSQPGPSPAPADGGIPRATARGGSLLGALLPGLASAVIHVRVADPQGGSGGTWSVPGGWLSRPWDLCRRLRNRESDDVCCRAFPWCLLCVKPPASYPDPSAPPPPKAYCVWKLMNLTSLQGPPARDPTWHLHISKVSVVRTIVTQPGRAVLGSSACELRPRFLTIG